MRDKSRLIITRPAYNDLNDIFDYIAQDNNKAAADLVQIIENKFNDLLMFPHLGSKRDIEYLRDVRMCVVAKHYQIIYSVRGNDLYVLRILSGYEDFC